MKGIKFAEPLFLYLLLVIPAMIAFYILKQQKVTASVRMPGLQPFATYRNYIQALSPTYSFCAPDDCISSADYCTCPSAEN